MILRKYKKNKNKTKLPKIGKRVVKNPFEYDVYKALKNLLPRGAVLEYETEKLAYYIEGDYIPDFIITKKDGSKIYIEAKGNGRAFDQKVKQKMIAVKTQHPELDIRIIFFSDGKVGSTRKDGTWMKQSDWAVKNGFPFSIRSIPEDWLDE